MHPDVAGKRVTVMGLGLHGGALGTVGWLLEQGANVTVTDLKTREQLGATIAQINPPPPPLSGGSLRYVLGQHREENFINTDLVIRNPGVPKNSPFLEIARRNNVPIEMDSSLFFLHCPTKNIIGITGSKGKTTAAKAITAVLQTGGKHVVEVGTDGASPLGKLKDVTADTIVVFELSSWRLEALAAHQTSPRIAVVTNIYREHLNTYASLQDYIETKKTIIRFQKGTDTAILCSDDAELRHWGDEVQGSLIWYSQDDAPTNVALLGKHQARNLVPAMIISKLYGVPEKTVNETITALRGLPHRLEQVAVKNKVTYINDSAATMPDATIAALDALGAQPLVLIIGGSDKELEFGALATRVAAANIRALVWLPGTATQRMQQELSANTSAPAQEAVNMEDAVRRAAEVAQAGDVVLLSPGATSFGLFQHEFDRGSRFVKAVQELN